MAIMLLFTLFLSSLIQSGVTHPVAEPSSAVTIPTNLPTAPVNGLWSNDPIYYGLVLQHHNVHRVNHSASNLEWNSTLASFAEKVAMSCVWGHNVAVGGGGYGQNIAAGYAPGKIGKVITNGFYNSEFAAYPRPWGQRQPDMSNFARWGHFSQIVWKNSKSVGCYTHTCTPTFDKPLECKPDGTSYLKGLKCGNGGIPAQFTVCNYYPFGNLGGAYDNVGAPLGRSTVVVTDTGTTGL